MPVLLYQTKQERRRHPRGYQRLIVLLLTPPFVLVALSSSLLGSPDDQFMKYEFAAASLALVVWGVILLRD